MAYGLPVQGEDGPFIGERASDVPTCDVGLTVSHARRELQESGADLAVVVAGDRLVVGEVDGEALAGHSDDAALIDVLRPVPSTYRPSVTVRSVAEDGGGRRLVTTPDGRLLGEAVVEAAGEGPDGHDGHDGHEGHDHPDTEAFEQELTEVMEAVEERFGEREPTAEELRTFLHDRLVAEGRSPEEADRFLDQLETAQGD